VGELMDFLIAIIIFAFSLIYSISKQISTIFPVILGMLAFSSVAYYRGYKLKAILGMLLRGMKKSLPLMPIFALIGMITALWRASGTIPFFVYYGTKILNPDYFILFSFLLTCFVSFALGTSFGTVGTIGIVLIVLAKSGNVDLYVTAGAVISGAFFGDRGSPLSSSANLVAYVTETDLYDNVKKMFITGALPFLASVAVYLFLSEANPINVTNTGLIEKFNLSFNLHISVILPACIIFLSAALKKDVKISMFLSLLTAIFVSRFIQNISLGQILDYMIFGYLNSDKDLTGIISGGGLVTMVSVSFVVLAASSYSGLFEGTGMLNDIQGALDKMSKKAGVYLTTLFTGLATCALCCNQTLPILLTKDLMGDIYKKNGLSKSHLAIDIENTVILVAELFPWSIAIGVPLATIGVGPKAIPYAVYLYLVPIMAPLTRR
jgi:NhaC family Na+:H+ antiporter